MMRATTPAKEFPVTQSTLFCAFDTGDSKWHLAFTVGAAQRPRRLVILAGDLTRCAQEISDAKARFGLPALYLPAPR